MAKKAAKKGSKKGAKGAKSAKSAKSASSGPTKRGSKGLGKAQDPNATAGVDYSIARSQQVYEVASNDEDPPTFEQLLEVEKALTHDIPGDPDFTGRNLDQEMKSCLHHCIINGYGNLAVILLDHGANVDCQDGEGRTPLHYALEEGSLELSIMLIRYGASTKVKDLEGAVPEFPDQEFIDQIKKTCKQFDGKPPKQTMKPPADEESEEEEEEEE